MIAFRCRVTGRGQRKSMSITFSVGQAEALKAAIDPSIRFLFITGPAGTGKSELIKRIAEADPNHTVLTATTGMAASLIDGATLHGTFKIPPEFCSPDDRNVSTVSIASQIKTLVIEEISMLRADIMDRLSRTLQYNLNNDKPFGGVKVIGIGDLAQICPVVTQEEREVFDSFYASPWWFDARVMQTCDISFRQLTQVFRQTDPGFLELLRRAREGNVPPRSRPWSLRKSRCSAPTSWIGSREPFSTT